MAMRVKLRLGAKNEEDQGFVLDIYLFLILIITLFHYY